MDIITIIQVLLLIIKMMIKRERQNNTKGEKSNHNENTLTEWGHWDWSDKALAIISTNTKWSLLVWMIILELRASSAPGRKVSNIQVPSYVSCKITPWGTWYSAWHPKGIGKYFLPDKARAISTPCRELPNCPHLLHLQFLPILLPG